MKKALILTAAALTVFAACTKEKDFVTEGKLPAGLVKASFIAEVDQTKATEDAAVFSWTSSDSVAVVAKNDHVKKIFLCTNTTDGEFTGALENGQEYGYAISPYQLAGDMVEDPSGILYEVNFKATYYDYVPGTTHAVMVGTPNGAGKFLFRHLAATLRFNIVNVPVGTAAFRLTTSKKITGTATLDATSNISVSDLDGGYTVTLNLKDPISAPNTTKLFYVPVPVGNYTSMTVEFLDDSSNVLDSKIKTGLNLNVARGDVYYTPTMTLNESDLSGDYLILAVGGGNWQVMSTTFNTKYWEKTATSVASDAVIDWTSSAVDFAALSNADHKWTLEKVSGQTGKYYLKHGDAYAHAGTSGNGSEDTTGEAFSVSYDPSTGAAHIAAESVELRYNTSAPRFTFYTTGGQAQVYLIPFVAAATPCELTISCASNTVTITATPDNAEIYYTIDGTDPDANSTLYSVPFAITQTVTVKAVAIAPSAEYADSQIVSQECTYVAPGTDVIYELYSGVLTAGSYILVYDGKAMNTTVDSDRLQMTDVTPSNNQILNPASSIIWTIAADGDYWTIYNENEQLYAASTGAKNKAKTESSVTDNSRWSVTSTSGSTTYDFINKQNTTNGVNAHLRRNTTYGFACYAAGTGGELTLYKLADSRPSPGMSWSSATATATYSTGNTLSFSAPTLTPGNATGITYESTDESIATISDAGVVSITALSGNEIKEGSTTIKAIFAGNTDYGAQTVSYTLTVVDSRDAVDAPTFSPAAGEVAANTPVTISYVSGATVYYTDDNSVPTTSSTQYTGAITIDAAKTIKAIAAKTGYKNSTVASAAYTIQAAAATIATILADNTITNNNTVNYTVSGVTVMAAQGDKNYVIGDATGVMLMYYNSALTVGNQYNITGDVKIYNGVHEFSNPTSVTPGTGTAPAYGTPETMTVSSLTSYASSPVTKYAVVHITAPSSGYVGSDGTNNINVFDGTGTWANFYGKQIIVTGYLIGYYNSKINILATSIEEDPNAKSITALKSSITGVSADGVTNASESGVYSLTNASDSDVTVTPDGTVVTSASVSGGALTYSVAANTGAARSGSVTLAVSGGNSIEITISQEKATGSTTPDPETITFADSKWGLENGVQYSDPFNGGNFTITFAGGGNDGKYYTTGSGIRTYGGGTITIAASSHKIKEIAFTWDGSNAPTSDVATPTGYSSSTKKWTGSANSVVLTRPSGSGHWRLKSVTVTYEN